MGWLPKIVAPGQELGAGGLFGAYTALTVAASAKVLLPAGLMYVFTDAHETVEITTDGGTTFETIQPVSTGALIISDGTNVYAVGDSTGGTAHYILVN